jgi:hypothetical protein
MKKFTVAQLIATLQTMPQDLPVEINDNSLGEVYPLHSVSLFEEGDIALEDEDYAVVMLQVNV